MSSNYSRYPILIIRSECYTPEAHLCTPTTLNSTHGICSRLFQLNVINMSIGNGNYSNLYINNHTRCSKREVEK